ncbi:hypothetical protein ACFL0W_00495 [Nanoarchaeota archaeon]
MFKMFMNTDIETKRELTKVFDEISNEELYSDNNDPFLKFIGWGIEAFAQWYVLQSAVEAKAKDMPIEDFIKTFDLKLPFEELLETDYIQKDSLDKMSPGFFAALDAIAHNGSVYIPEQAYTNGDGEQFLRRINTYHSHLYYKDGTGSMVGSEPPLAYRKVDLPFDEELNNLVWRGKNIYDDELVSKAIEHTKASWNEIVKYFNEHKDGFKKGVINTDSAIPPVDPKLATAALKLIEHYNELINRYEQQSD